MRIQLWEFKKSLGWSVSRSDMVSENVTVQHKEGRHWVSVLEVWCEVHERVDSCEEYESGDEHQELLHSIAFPLLSEGHCGVESDIEDNEGVEGLHSIHG